MEADDPVRGPGAAHPHGAAGRPPAEPRRDRPAARPAAVDRARDRAAPCWPTGWSSRSTTPASTGSGRPCSRWATSTSTRSSCGRGSTPWAEDLARRTGLAVRTAVMLVDDVVVVHHEPRPDGSRQMPEVGIVIPAHACALGKAMLAFDEELSEGVLAGRTAAQHDRRDRHRPEAAAPASSTRSARPGSPRRSRRRCWGSAASRPC